MKAVPAGQHSRKNCGLVALAYTNPKKKSDLSLSLSLSYNLIDIQGNDFRKNKSSSAKVDWNYL